MSKNIAIIGSGYIGISAASELIKQGHKVTIFESSNNVGGLANGIKLDDKSWHIEPYYHHWFNGEEGIKKLAKDHHLSHLIDTYSPLTSFYEQGEFIPFDSPLHIILYPHLNVLEKARLVVGLAILKLSRNYKKFERYTVEEWLIKYMGYRVYTKLWKPMMIGKWGKQYHNISMSWFWARIYTRTKSLMYPQGGFENFNTELIKSLSKKGLILKLNSGVDQIEVNSLGDPTLLVGNKKLDFERVLFTSSPKILKKITKNLKINIKKDHINKLEYCSAISYLFASKIPVIEREYWLNIPAKNSNFTESDIPFLVFVQHTNMISKEHYSNLNIGYCGNYLSPEDKFFKLSDEEIEEYYLNGIKKINPTFKRSDIVYSKISRANYAQPIIKKNHSKLLPGFDIFENKVFWASMNHVYPWDRGTNYAAILGTDVADVINSSF